MRGAAGCRSVRTASQRSSDLSYQSCRVSLLSGLLFGSRVGDKTRINTVALINDGGF